MRQTIAKIGGQGVLDGGQVGPGGFGRQTWCVRGYAFTDLINVPTGDGYVFYWKLFVGNRSATAPRPNSQMRCTESLAGANKISDGNRSGSVFRLGLGASDAPALRPSFAF